MNVTNKMRSQKYYSFYILVKLQMLIHNKQNGYVFM